MCHIKSLRFLQESHIPYFVTSLSKITIKILVRPKRLQLQTILIKNTVASIHNWFDRRNLYTRIPKRSPTFASPHSGSDARVRTASSRSDFFCGYSFFTTRSNVGATYNRIIRIDTHRSDSSWSAISMSRIILNGKSEFSPVILPIYDQYSICLGTERCWVCA